jgi:hypothetical protein
VRSHGARRESPARQLPGGRNAVEAALRLARLGILHLVRKGGRGDRTVVTGPLKVRRAHVDARLARSWLTG